MLIALGLPTQRLDDADRVQGFSSHPGGRACSPIIAIAAGPVMSSKTK
jgi:hypothetical protein